MIEMEKPRIDCVEMSEDGLIYTFYLKQGQKWDSLADFSAEVRADDFVFAFHVVELP